MKKLIRLFWHVTKRKKNAEWEVCKSKLVHSLSTPPTDIHPLAQAAIVELCKACFMSGYGRGSHNTAKGLLNDLGLGFLVDLVETNASVNPLTPLTTTANPSLN